MTARARHPVWLVVMTVLVAALVVPTATAGAEPDDAHTGAPSLGVLTERYNAARYRAERAAAALAEQERQLEQTRVQAEALRQRARERAALLYRRAGSGTIGLLAVGDAAERGRRSEYVGAAERPERVLLEELEQTRQRLAAEREQQLAAKAGFEAEAKAAAEARRVLMAEAARAAAARAPSAGDGAGPVGTPVSMRQSGTSVAVPTAPRPVAATPPAPAAPTAAPRPSPPPSAAPSTPAPPPPPPAASSKAAIAVSYARAQLGKPYVFATSGPDTFDCSGLTMAAWRAAGVRMPHYSVAQAQMFPKVGWSDLQPGDLVLYYSDLHHVGLYIGGGQMIHAPQTGDVVKIAPAWRTTFQFGVRPR